jgi:hypothetical protein
MKHGGSLCSQKRNTTPHLKSVPFNHIFNHTIAAKLTLLSVAAFIKTAGHPPPFYINLVFVPNSTKCQINLLRPFPEFTVF